MQIAVGIVIILVVLSGLIYSPWSLFITGFVFLFLVYLTDSSSTDLNPYKQMSYTSVPDDVELKTWSKKHENMINKQHRKSSSTSIYLYYLSLALLLSGFILLTLKY